MPGVELIVFPDPEEVLISFYNTAFAVHDGFQALEASGSISDPRPAEFVRVLLTGGTNDGLAIDTPQLTTESWAQTAERASAIAQFCRSLIYAAARAGSMGPVTIYTVTQFTGPHNLPDPVTDQIRYTATHAIDMRGNAA